MRATVRCDKCLVVVRPIENETNGCGCDPDAPTWIAYLANGRFMAMSHSRMTLVNEDDSPLDSN